MDDSVNQRIKKLRKTIGLTQNEFSRVIAISSGQLACIETGKRVVNDRTIKLICDSFKVSDRWLRRGEEPVFTEDTDTRYAKVAALYDALKPEYRDFIMEAINHLLIIQKTDRKADRKAEG
ncbi:MAG: helix-turn-helix domain-containing protein [Treponema sp.]|jgi:transcriptional regulator with XRE-family HTH domain|nr:helix-turn-helix domain-containing protein [Treponema sp.]